MPLNSLEPYRKRRRFARTTEPKGIVRKRASKKPIFVIQRHEATNLHYDFRIEIGGVLKSWAIPKGISTNPAVKRLAIPTEDHPMAYARFEGVIPEGEYGAGPVMVWDIGTYRSLKKVKGKLVTMKECLKIGRIEVWLEGQKLHGGYALIRTKRTKSKNSDKYWLLIKMKDEYAHKAIKNTTKSALTGHTMKQIERDA